MAKYTLSGTLVSLGTTTAIDFSSEAAALAAFAADTYRLIGGTETLSDFGDTATDAPFTGLAESRTVHLKGPSDGGMIEITCAELSADLGQQAVKLAADPDNQDEYNLRIAWKNGDVAYYRGPVMGFGRVNGAGSAVAKRKFSIANNYGEVLDLA